MIKTARIDIEKEKDIS